MDFAHPQFAEPRWLWLAGLFINIGLLAWVSLIVPTLGRISLGFLPSGAAGTPSAGAGLILIPVLSIFLFALGWVMGLVFYRSEPYRVLAHIVWASGLVTSVLFLVAVIILVGALTFIPALALGPIVEHLLMIAR